MTQYITLQAWAEKKFDPMPHRNTLHRWATDGSIVPAPFKLGTTYMVTPDARHVNEPAPAGRLVHRLNGLASA
ncbi:MAG: excisionase [Proteobacteria bacterium]|nr:excisionase [Pseudomonadota bacterium]